MREDDERQPSSRNPEDPTRLLALTDGVFSIIMTILVLTLTVPVVTDIRTLGLAIISQGARFAAYVISFLLAGVYWAGHRMMFAEINRVSSTIVWMNTV